MYKNIVMALILTLFVFVSGNAYSQTSFAILPMEVRTGIQQEIAEETLAGLNNVLIGSNRYTMIDRIRVKDVLNEQVFQYSGLTDKNNVVKLGHLLNVEKFIYTTLYKKANDQLVLRCRVIDVTTGQIELNNEKSFHNNSPENVGRYSAGAIIAKYPLLGKIEGSVKGDSIVNLGKKHGIKNGDRLFVARKNVIMADDGKSLFSELVRVGILEVLSVNDEWSKVKISRLANGMTSLKKDDVVSPDPIPSNAPVVSNTPLVRNVKKGEAILEDDMQKHQYLFVMNNDGDSYQQGKFNLVTLPKSNYRACGFYPPPFDKLQNFILEGEIEFKDVQAINSYLKIYFRSEIEKSKQYKGYVLYLNGNSQYTISIDGNENNNYIIPVASTPHLNKGTARNRFKIIANDSKFDIYINDKYLMSFEDELYTQGMIGLLAQPGISVNISNISIWKIEKESADVPSVTSSPSAVGGAWLPKSDVKMHNLKKQVLKNITELVEKHNYFPPDLINTYADSFIKLLNENNGRTLLIAHDGLRWSKFTFILDSNENVSNISVTQYAKNFGELFEKNKIDKSEWVKLIGQFNTLGYATTVADGKFKYSYDFEKGHFLTSITKSYPRKE
jgi:hypothetical protein